MSTHHKLSEREQEILLLEGEIINAWVASGGKLPQNAFVALLSGATNACEQTVPYAEAEAAADRALDRLRKVAEAVRS